MASAVPAHDRMAHVLVDFIRHRARSIPDEISRAEAAMRALPEISVSAEGEPSDPEAWCMLWQLHEHVEKLKELASLRTPRPEADCHLSD